MMLKNKTITRVSNATYVLASYAKFANARIFIPKGFYFSSLSTNFSLPSLGAKGISNKAISPATQEKAYIAQGLSASYAKQLADATLVRKATQNIASVGNANLGPINNNKLLNYNFIGGVSVANSPGASTTKGISFANVVAVEEIIKLISAFFKSIYCLISRPKFINTPDKIIIEILYYITIPDNNIFKWYNFIYNRRIARLGLGASAVNGQGTTKILRLKKKVAKKKSIKTILSKNFLIKKTLFKLNNTNIVNLYFNKFSILFKLLQANKQNSGAITYSNTVVADGTSNSFLQLINKPIEFNLIRLHKSDYDSNILAQLFILILKKKNIRIAINKIYNKNNILANNSLHKIANAVSPKGTNLAGGQDKVKPGMEKGAAFFLPGKKDNFIPAIISGLYIKIGGRLMREPIIPRLTTKKFEVGAIATGKVNFVDSARITKKNKKGAFTIKITYAQNFVF